MAIVRNPIPSHSRILLPWYLKPIHESDASTLIDSSTAVSEKRCGVMSRSTKCRKSTVVHASCDNCGRRPEIIHKPAERRGASYCGECCPECRDNQPVKRGLDISSTSLPSAAINGLRQIPSPGALMLTLQSHGMAVVSRSVYAGAGLEHGLEIDGYFYPVRELNSDENRADLAALNFASIRRRREQTGLSAV